MDYKSMMGYGKKKKVIKEQIKPKVNKVLKGLKKELNESDLALGVQTMKDNPPFKTQKQLKEVGMSSEIKMYTHAINKNYDRYWDSVKELQKYLAKKGAQKISKQIGSLYTGHVGKFHHWMKTKFIQLVRKMI
tara:strand:+ start:1040 stop:1438 length:399 start_codon:yes stop_codon:yes gene_type:complete